MTWAVVLAVAAGGAIGAPVRHFVDKQITASVTRANAAWFPWGLLTVNALGSLLLGITYSFTEGPWRELLATGVCGALTTYSSYAYFVNRTWNGNRMAAWWAIGSMPVVCIAAAGIGITLTRAVLP